MTENQISTLITEIRADYQIPPYLSDDVIRRSIEECAARLQQLKDDATFDDADLTGKMLLKNYVYYSIYHKTEEFEHNYQQMILSWQHSGQSENTEDSEDESGS